MRPKLNEDKKRKNFSISLSPEIIEKLNKIHNRSQLIEKLLEKYFNKNEKIK